MKALTDSESEKMRLRKLTIDTYNQYSILPSVVNLQKSVGVDSDTPHKFARHLTVDHWLDQSYVHDLVFIEMGRVIGLSETKYLVERIEKEIRPVSGNAFDMDLISHHAHELSEKKYNPTALILPIQLYREFFNKWVLTRHLKIHGPGEQITLDGLRMRLVWSNKFVPLSRALIVNKYFADWTCSPSPDDRIQVNFAPKDETNMDVQVESKFRMEIKRPELVVSLDIPNLPALDVE
jgi:hypothetical protein